MSALEVASQDGVATVTINRPESRNAFDPEVVVRLAETWPRLGRDREVRAIVLTGAGDRAFCAGGDLRRLVPLLTRSREPEDEWDRRLLADQRSIMNAALLRDGLFPKPIVACVNGSCVAGGTELMLATDVRVAVAGATIALSEVQLGLIPGGGSVVRLPRQVPSAIASEMLLTGEPITVERAHQVGLVNAVVPPDAVREIAAQTAARIANNAPMAVRAVKSVMARTRDVALEEAFRIEDDANRRILRSSDAREGARAFGEGRPPEFRGQ